MEKKQIYYVSTIILILVLNYSVHGGCYPSVMGKANFPDSIQPELIYGITGISPQVCGIAMKQWPYKDSLFIVYSEDTADYHIHLLRQNNKKFNVITHFSAKHSENGYRFSGFDFAPYTIREGQTAIGIRFLAKGPTMGGGWKCEKLALYEFSGNEIRPVLFTVINYSAEGNNVAYDFNMAFYCEEKGIIIIGKTDDSGYNQFIEKVGNKKYVFKYSSGENSTGKYTCNNLPECLSDSVSNCFCPSEEQ